MYIRIYMVDIYRIEYTCPKIGYGCWSLVGNIVVSLATMTKSSGLPALHGGDSLDDSLEPVYYHHEYKGFRPGDDANCYDPDDLSDVSVPVGTLKDGYVRKVPLPRAPRIQHANSVLIPEHDTCYFAQVPRIPTWSDLTRSLAGLGRRTLLPFFPVVSVAH